jgi:hypothetical protein
MLLASGGLPYRREVREPAPPYANEGPFALWHVSEDAEIEEFRPHRAATALEDEVLVWAIDTRHLPMYWFPRDCPRGTFWGHSGTSDEDVERFLDGDRSRRVHALQGDWLERFRATRLVAYRLPQEPFEPHHVGGYWIARESVRPLDRVDVGDLLMRHAEAAIELRVVPDLARLWGRVIASTLEFSGVRLANLH